MTCGIYKIENLKNGKIYIGQSIEIERRFQKHLVAKDDFYIHKALRKYGKENFTFQIIEECDLKILNEREIYWINFYNSLIPNGYNMNSGGSNGMGFSKRKPVKQYTLTGDYIQTFQSAIEASDKTGICHSDICACCRKKYKKAGNFIWRYLDDLSEITPLSSIRTDFTVLQLDKNYDIILSEFKSISEASKITGVAKATICKVCNGKGKTAGGYRWRYKVKE